MTARSPSLQGVRIAMTDSGGRFRMPGLPPGKYEVRAALSGFQTVGQPGLVLPVDREITLEFQLLPSFSEELTVLGAPSFLDLTSAATGTLVERDTFETLPMARTYLDLAFLAPGVVNTPNAQPSIAGASSAENRFIVDGLDTTDPGFGTLVSALPPEFLEMVEIKTGGYGVEYGGALGGVLNVLTRSGSNVFHGSVFGYYTDDGFGSDPPESLRNGQFRGSQTYDYGATLGGRILRDRLWYFLGFNPASTQSDWITNQRLSVTDQSEKLSYVGKLSWQLHPSHRLVASAFGNPHRGTSTSIYLFAAGLMGNRSETTSRHFVVSYDAIPGRDLMLELSAGRYEQETRTLPAAERPWYIDLTGGRFARAENCGDPERVANGISFAPGCVGGTFAYDPLEGLRDELRLAATWHGSTGRLDHKVKAGAVIRQVEFEFNVRYPAPVPGPFYDSAGTLVNAAGLRGQRWSLRPDFAVLEESSIFFPAGPGRNEELALYLQDQVAIAEHWTVQLGVRAETFDSTGRKTNQDSDARLKFALKDMIGPRVGLVWNPVGKGRSKVFAHYARYYESVPLWINTLAFGSARSNSHTFSYPADGALPSAENPGVLISGGSSLPPGSSFGVASDLEAQHTDEYLLGMEYQLGQDISVGLTGVYREVGDVIEDFAIDDPTTPWIVGNPGGTITRHPVTGVTLEAPVTFAEPKREYRALQLTFQKRLRGRWQLAGSYVYSKNEGNYAGLIDGGALAPNITPNFDLPELAYNASGPLPNDRTHQAKLYGSYRWSFGLTTGFFAQYQSGTPISKLGEIYGPLRFITPRGSAGRTPAVFTLDLRTEYPIRLPRAGLTVALFADLFNLTNDQKPTYMDEIWTNAGAAQTADPHECGGPGTGPGTACPEGNPNWGQPILFQEPRALRVGARLTW